MIGKIAARSLQCAVNHWTVNGAIGPSGRHVT